MLPLVVLTHHATGCLKMWRTTMTLREQRLQDAINSLTRTTAQRDACMANLVRYELRLKDLRRKVERLRKAVAAPAKAPPIKPVPYQPGASLASKIDDALSAEPDLTIPPFLQRVAASKAKDEAAAAEIKAAAVEKKTAKARGRIETMKAKQRGDMRKMPLTGKAALEAIRQG